MKEQTETLTEDKEKLLSGNEKLKKQQKKLQQEINKMVQSKEVMERNIHVYDEDIKWQLAEPGALMSAKNYRDKKTLPLVEKLKEVVKNLTIKCVQLTEQGRKLTAKVDGQQKQISRLTDKVMEQNDTIDRLQERASDLGRLERHFGREQLEQSKALEQAERANKRSKPAFEMSRKEVQNLIDWVCLSEQIKENNNTIHNLTGEYKKIEPDCREGVRAQLEHMKELCKERNNLCMKSRTI